MTDLDFPQRPTRGDGVKAGETVMRQIQFPQSRQGHQTLFIQLGQLVVGEIEDRERLAQTGST